MATLADIYKLLERPRGNVSHSVNTLQRNPFFRRFGIVASGHLTTVHGNDWSLYKPTRSTAIYPESLTTEIF